MTKNAETLRALAKDISGSIYRGSISSDVDNDDLERWVGILETLADDEEIERMTGDDT